MDWTATLTMTTVTCDCGVVYALDNGFISARKKDRKTFYCPNGCTRWYPGISDDEKVRRAEARAASARERAEHYERSRNAYRGHLTRTKRRIASGVCPCCNRTFKQLAAHMKRQHPEYTGGES